MNSLYSFFSVVLTIWTELIDTFTNFMIGDMSYMQIVVSIGLISMFLSQFMKHE